MNDWLDEIARRLNITINAQQTAQYLDYVRLLRHWNEKINLTAVVDDEGIAVRHLLDSLTLLPCLTANSAPLKLIDVGTGAGFPGIPLKIQRPDLEVLLLDSLGKRVKFLQNVIETLGLSGISARHGRAEDVAQTPEFREKFDIATARAVASLPVLCEYCLPFVRVGGVFLAMKGKTEDWSVANHAIKVLGGELSDVREFDLPGTDMKRTILTIRKTAVTPKSYPRKAGMPEKETL